MPSYRGPARDYRAVLPQERDEDGFGRSLERAATRLPVARIDTSYMEEQNRQREQKERTEQELAMTPGVRKGPANPYARAGTAGIANNPYLQERSFQRNGQTYTFDPLAEQEVRAGVPSQQEQQQRARFESLTAIPGMDRKKAARLVFGRSGVQDVDSDGDNDPLRIALSEYMLRPSRQTAAAAIRAGADLNKFPDKFADEEPQTPVRGTPEYEQMLEREYQLRNRFDMSEQRADERETATALREAGTEVRARRSQAGATRRELQSVLARRPRPGQYVDPLTREVDPEQLSEALRNFRSDSTMTHNAFRADSTALAESENYLRELGGGTKTGSAPATSRTSPAADVAPATEDATPVVSRPPAQAAGATSANSDADEDDGPMTLQSLTEEHAVAVARIRALKVGQDEKNRRIAEANRRFREAKAELEKPPRGT